MPKNLLAVDDSATMRKVLEITFSGEDFNVLSADGRAAALAHAGESPSVVIIDTSLPDDGYAVCKDLRAKLPRAAIILMSSRYSPYDAGKGKDAGADENVDKPFDTQQFIDKVKKLLSAKEASGPAPEVRSPPPPVVAPHPPAPPVMPSPPQSPPGAMPRISGPGAGPGIPGPGIPGPGIPGPGTGGRPYQPGPMASRSATLMFEGNLPAPPQPGGPPPHAAPPPPPHAPPPPPIAAAPPPPAPPPVHQDMPTRAPAPPAAPVAVATAHVNGQLAPRLAELGLTKPQIEGVLSLSREIIEQVVWEVVPQLAETIIKEEIARLTKE